MKLIIVFLSLFLLWTPEVQAKPNCSIDFVVAKSKRLIFPNYIIKGIVKQLAESKDKTVEIVPYKSYIYSIGKSFIFLFSFNQDGCLIDPMAENKIFWHITPNTFKKFLQIEVNKRNV